MSLSPQNTIRKVKKIYIYVNLGVFSTHVVDKGLIISIFKGASEIHVKSQFKKRPKFTNLQVRFKETKVAQTSEKMLHLIHDKKNVNETTLPYNSSPLKLVKV